MNKAELVRSISKKTKLTIAQSQSVLDAATETIIEALTSNEEVGLKGFGTFKVVKKEARVGRNPKSGEPVSIPAKRKATFRFSKEVDLN